MAKRILSEFPSYSKTIFPGYQVTQQSPDHSKRLQVHQHAGGVFAPA